MTNEIFILEIYKKTIDNIMLGIDEKYKDEVCLAYLDYLKAIYLDFFSNAESIKLDKLVNLFVNLEKSKWRNSSPESRLSEILKDPAFENIKYISNTGYKYAQARLAKSFGPNTETFSSPVIDEDKARDSINMLHVYCEQVRDFNKKSAKYYVSEGIVDFLYASGVTKSMSLRTGRIKK